MIFAFIIAILSALVTASTGLSSLCALDCESAMSGEIWRLLSGHLTHMTWGHYFADAIGFVIFYSMLRKRIGVLSSILLAFISAVIVSLTVVFSGIHQVYGGLSGLICAAVSAELILSIREARRRGLLYVICIFYCGFLLYGGFFVTGIKAAQEAHLAGAATGAIFILLSQTFFKPSFLNLRQRYIHNRTLKA